MNGVQPVLFIAIAPASASLNPPINSPWSPLRISTHGPPFFSPCILENANIRSCGNSSAYTLGPGIRPHQLSAAQSEQPFFCLFPAVAPRLPQPYDGDTHTPVPARVLDIKPCSVYMAPVCTARHLVEHISAPVPLMRINGLGLVEVSGKSMRCIRAGG